MRNATDTSQDFTELARQAFANNGYVPSEALLTAAAKGLARLVDPSPEVSQGEAHVSVHDMLKRCAGV